MIEPSIPDFENDRQAALNRYQILDTAPEPDFDDITALMSYISSAPISLIAFLDRDRNWMKSSHGVEITDSPRSISFCGHTCNTDENILVVEDARLDDRFHDNPLVSEQGAIFYAGVPLQTPDGYKIGTLCVFDNHVRALDETSKKALITLGKQVMNLLLLRDVNELLKKANHDLNEKNRELAQFAAAVSHDLKSPLNGIGLLMELLGEANEAVLDADAKEMLHQVGGSVSALSLYVDNLFALYSSQSVNGYIANSCRLEDIMSVVKQVILQSEKVEFDYPSYDVNLWIDQTVLEQIFINLVSNAIKYCDKKIVKIEIKVSEDLGKYLISVQDNGVGIEPAQIGSIFDQSNYSEVSSNSKLLKNGSGLGIVKRLVTRIGGVISVTSIVGSGTKFILTIPIATAKAASSQPQ